MAARQPAEHKTLSQYGIDVLWCLLVPVVVVAVYLVLGIGLVSVIGEPILGTVLLGGIVVIAVLVVRRFRPTWLGYLPAPTTTRAAPNFKRFVIGGAVLAFLAGQALALWFYTLAGSTAFDESIQTRQDAGALVALLLVMIAAPLGEEALFRGTIYPLLRKRASIIVSILISAGVFALMHGNAVQFASALPLAVLLALVYERTRALGPCMLLHLGFNLAATLIPAQLLSGLANPVSALLLTAAFAGYVVVLYRRITGSNHDAQSMQGSGNSGEDGPRAA